jgi:hypothetical protein
VRSRGQLTVVAKYDNPVSQIGPFSFSGFKTKEDVENHCARDGTTTPLVSSRTHAQPEEEDPVDAGAKAAEEVTEKERDEHFNTIRWMIPIKQEWRVKEKTSTPMLTTYDDDMDLLDDNKSPLIKDGSPPPTIKDINMVFMLSAEFRGIEEEITQMCLGPKQAMFKKPESSQYLKLMYI